MMLFAFPWSIILIAIRANEALGALNCPRSSQKFEKVIGLPAVRVDQRHLLLQLAQNETDRPITLDCLNSCKTNDACISFVLLYDQFACYWLDHDATETYGNARMDADNDAIWFVKICLEEEKPCTKAWTFERVRGATLIGNDTKTLSKNVSRTECEQVCLNETTFECKSVKFKINFDYAAKVNNETTGRCVLSNSARHLMPNAFRVSTYDEYYMENQCISSRDDPINDYCSFEEYEAVALDHADAMLQLKTKEECQQACEKTESFNCRGFSLINASTKLCVLHSEDTKLRGPRALRTNPSATYYEKARCLNISVACSESYMAIRYQPETNFRGKLYMQGYSEIPECYVVGQGSNAVITLKLPLLTSQCGIIKADSPANRTLLAGTLIIQYNELIQTQSDRVLKVGCIFGNESKLLIGTGVTITSNLPNKGSTLINTLKNQTVAPVVEMKVIDLRTQQEATDSQIGQELQLIIELKEQTNTLDLWAGHLIAMTENGNESIFLLDDRGCPINLNIFPQLTKIVTNGTRKLTATFQAFKFASSPIVRFSVIIQFCPNECPPVKCNRKRREITPSILQTIKGNKVLLRVANNTTGVVENKSMVVNQMPLEYIMLVRDSQFHPDRLILGNKDTKILVAGYNYTTNEVCMDYSLVIGLIVTWIIVQLVFIITCIALVKRYKRYYEQECSRTAMEHLHKNFGLGFSNLENRRVRWADNGENIIL